MVQQFLVVRILAVALALAIPSVILGDAIAKASGGGASIEWTVAAGPHHRIELRVADPHGEIYTRTFEYGSTVSFHLEELAEVVDGHYSYEMRLIPKVSAELRKTLDQARATGDEAAIRKLLREAGLSELATQSGGFQVDKGSIVTPGLVEPGADALATSDGAATHSAGPGSSRSRPGRVAVNDQVIPDDLIVQGSACVGPSCVNNEAFGGDTLRLKEPTIAVHFEDTSTGPGFPSNDWRVRINDNTSGGLNYFSIEDATGIRIPFLVKAGAPTNSLHVDSTGRIGFRTSTPAKDLHVSTGDTPVIRFEQNSSGGFTAQTWDIAGNEVNFFVRDTTNGDLMPFRIRPGAPTSSIDIAGDGDVGIGTANPQVKLDIQDTTANRTAVRIRNTQATGNSGIEYLDNAGNVDLFFGVQNSSSTTRMNSVNNNPIVMLVNSTERMRVNTTGVTVTGDFSVTGVKSFAMVDPADPRRAIYYAALEGPEAGTYYRGSAKTVEGRVVIELPGYFTRITEPENITVQLTPQGHWGKIYVAEKAHDRLVIMVAEGEADLSFDYFVQGIRRGYSNYQVERKNDLSQ